MQIHGTTYIYYYYQKYSLHLQIKFITFCVDCSDVCVSVPRTPRHVVEDSTKKQWSRGIKTKSARIRQYYRVYTICHT